MTHRRVSAVLGLALLASITACTPDPVDDDELITQWRADRQANVDADGSFAAVLSSEARADEDGVRVEATLDSPAMPTAITFDCFGEGTIDLEIESIATTPATMTTTSTLGTYVCADGPHEIDPTTLGTEPVSSVAAVTANADRGTAWFLTVRGDTASS